MDCKQDMGTATDDVCGFIGVAILLFSVDNRKEVPYQGWYETDCFVQPLDLYRGNVPSCTSFPHGL